MAEMKETSHGELLCGEVRGERETLIELVLGLSDDEVQWVIALAGRLLAPQ